MNLEPNPAPSDPSAALTVPPHRAPRLLWAAIAVLAMAVAAMGGILLKQNAGSALSNTAPAHAASASTTPSNLAGLQAAPNDGIPSPLPAAPVPVPVPVVTAPVPAARPQSSSPAPMVAGLAPRAATPAPSVMAPPAPRCTVCGHVESVHTVQREQRTSGVGAVAGGVLGGVVGNQIGRGNGRTAATVLGAVGGGFLGNHIERRTHTLTRYEVTVRMDDGSRRTVETGTAPPIGKDVTLNGQVLRPADRHL